ncbi:hypothetical protein MVEN_02026700 [Mycena venus]|uniref:Thiamine-binding protein domain-containing protein n=1 Tax=Mycena venus TaxID=2733690 RepID=A0A8H6XB57_9AGAR|nr:hypothetical protein MVEN_02026700 [Mycena venus]
MSDDLYAVADFCLIPIGTGESSVAEYIAECQRILSKSGLTYKVYPQATIVVKPTFETPHNPPCPWSAVSKAIHDCHAAVHARGAPRVATDIRIGTRVDRQIVPGTGNDHKIRRVEEILEKDSAA